MKTIVTALLLVSLALTSAQAQSCKSSSGKVCRGRNGTSCYKTKYAQNFPICNDQYGYHICCEKPAYGNATNPNPTRVYNTNNTDQNAAYQYENGDNNCYDQQQSAVVVAPQSQSYPSDNYNYSMNSSGSYEGYYPSPSPTKRGRIKVCYFDFAKAPYTACPSPQYDGADKNLERNINTMTPSDASYQFKR